jgi:hypothetical protein
MVNAPSMPPMQAASLRKLEKFHVYLLLILGIALFGAGITVIGLVTASAATVSIGAGAVAAAGLLSVVFAVLGFSLDVKEDAEIVAENTHSTPPLVHDPFGGDQRPRWPPKSAEPMQYERRWRS